MTTQLTATQELQVRRNAARHLSGIPARQNTASIDLLETLVTLERIESEDSAEERALWVSMEQPIGLATR